MALGKGCWSQAWEVCDCHFNSSCSFTTAHCSCPQPWPRLFWEDCVCKGAHQPPNTPSPGLPPWTLSRPRGMRPASDTPPRQLALFPLQGLSSGC